MSGVPPIDIGISHENLGASQWELLQRVRTGGVMVPGDWEKYQQFYQSAFTLYIPLESLDNRPILPFTFTQVVLDVRDDKGESWPLLLIKRTDTRVNPTVIGGLDGRRREFTPHAAIRDIGYNYDFYSVVDDKFTNCNPNDISLLNPEVVPAPYPDAMIGADRFRVVALADAQLIDIAYCQDSAIIDQWLKIQKDKLQGRLGRYEDGFQEPAIAKLKSEFIGYDANAFTKNYLKSLTNQLTAKGWQKDSFDFNTVVGGLIMPRIMYLTGPDGEGVFSRDGVLDFIRETILDKEDGRVNEINTGLMPHLLEAFCKQTMIAPTEQSAKQIEDLCKLFAADELQLNSIYPDSADSSSFLLLLAEAIAINSHRSQTSTQESALAISNAREILLQALIKNLPTSNTLNSDKILQQLVLGNEDQAKRMGYVIKFIDLFSIRSANEIADEDLATLLDIIDKETGALTPQETMSLHHKLTEIWGEKLAGMFKQNPDVATNKPLRTRLLLARAVSTRQPIAAAALKSVTEPRSPATLAGRFGGSGRQFQQQPATTDPAAVYLILNSDNDASRKFVEEYKYDVYGQQLEVIMHTEKAAHEDKSRSLEQIELILDNLYLLRGGNQDHLLSAKAAVNVVEQVKKSIDLNSTATIDSIFSIIRNASRLNWQETPAQSLLDAVDARFSTHLPLYRGSNRNIITLLKYCQHRANVFSTKGIDGTPAKVATSIEFLTKNIATLLKNNPTTNIFDEIAIVTELFALDKVNNPKQLTEQAPSQDLLTISSSIIEGIGITTETTLWEEVLFRLTDDKQKLDFANGLVQALRKTRETNTDNKYILYVSNTEDFKKNAPESLLKFVELRSRADSSKSADGQFTINL